LDINWVILVWYNKRYSNFYKGKFGAYRKISLQKLGEI